MDKSEARLVSANGELIATAETGDKEAPSKAPMLGKLGDPIFSVPPTYKPYQSGKAGADGKKNGAIKCAVGFVTYQVMTPGGLHNVNGVIQATRVADDIDANGVKRQKVTYAILFGAVGYDADQMEPANKELASEWHQSLRDEFRKWRTSKNIAAPLLVVGQTGEAFTD